MKQFVIGFVIGAAGSAVVVLATTPESGAETRRRLIVAYSYARQRMLDTVHTALEAGRLAAATREQELWAEFHRRLQESKNLRQEQ